MDENGSVFLLIIGCAGTGEKPLGGILRQMKRTVRIFKKAVLCPGGVFGFSKKLSALLKAEPRKNVYILDNGTPCGTCLAKN